MAQLDTAEAFLAISLWPSLAAWWVSWNSHIWLIHHVISRDYFACIVVEHQPLLDFLALKSSRMASVSWSPHLGSFHICRHVCGCSCDTSWDSFSTSQLSYKPAFTQTRFSTHHLLHQPALAQTSFYPHQLLRKPTFRPTSFYTNIRTPSQTTFCTNHVLHQPTLTTQLLHQLLRPALDAPNSFGMSGTLFLVTFTVRGFVFGTRFLTLGDSAELHTRCFKNTFYINPKEHLQKS